MWTGHSGRMEMLLDKAYFKDVTGRMHSTGMERITLTPHPPLTPTLSIELQHLRLLWVGRDLKESSFNPPAMHRDTFH